MIIFNFRITDPAIALHCVLSEWLVCVAAMPSSPATPGPSVIASQQDVQVEFERLQIIEEPPLSETDLHIVEEGEDKTPSGDQTEEEEGFVDAQTDPESDGSNNNVVDNPQSPAPCATTADTDSTVIGASF